MRHQSIDIIEIYRELCSLRQQAKDAGCDELDIVIQLYDDSITLHWGQVQSTQGSLGYGCMDATMSNNDLVRLASDLIQDLVHNYYRASLEEW